MMAFTRWCLFALLFISISGCGPDTIFVRPGLDTPQQHVSNGQQLLQRGKVMDACREFERARELDPQYVQAYIGLGIAYGQKGDFEAGLETMQQASQLAQSESDRQAVQRGMEQLRQMQSAN